MKKLFEFLLNCIFPNKCSACREIICTNSLYNLCQSCISKVRFISNNCCHCCGKEKNNFDFDICLDCRQNHHHFDRAYSVARYSGIIKNLLISYKFHNRREIQNTLLSLMEIKIPVIPQVDIVIGVPSHKSKLKDRGFNQAEELAMGMVKRMKIEFDNKSLVKVLNTTSQSTLGRDDRMVNLKDAFRVVNRDKIQGKDILIIDDIYTTGSTSSECAKVLKQSGAKKVYVLTVASGEGY